MAAISVMIGSLPSAIAIGKILAARLGMGDVDGDVVLRHGLDAEPVGALHLQAIDADILDVVIVPIVEVAADDARLVDEEARRRRG